MNGSGQLRRESVAVFFPDQAKFDAVPAGASDRDFAYITLPWSGLWVLGTLIAIELIIHGAAWLEFGLGLRRFR